METNGTERDENILDDLFSGAKNSLLERFSSPLISSFTIAWLIVNFKFLVIFFSDADINNKIELFDTYFARVVFYVDLPSYRINIEHWFLYGLLVPITSTYLYLYKYPILAKRVAIHILMNQIELKSEKNRINKKVLKTVEEVDDLTNQYLANIRKRQLEIDALHKQISILENHNNALEDRVNSNQSEEEDNLGKTSLAPETSLAKSFLPKLSTNEIDMLKIFGSKYDQAVFKVRESELIGAIKLSPSKYTVAKDTLIKLNYIYHVKADVQEKDRQIALTNEGIRAYTLLQD